MSTKPSYCRREFQQIYIYDSFGAPLQIQIRDPNEPFKNEGFDCVSLSARYDHGFGFSQLYRFVDDKESKDIEEICDIANADLVSKLLHPAVSKKWRVLVTPVIKSNDLKFTDFYQKLMLEIINEAKSIACTKLLISQFNRMFKYKKYHFEGIIGALNETKKGSFGYLELIRFEIESCYREAVFDQLQKGLG